MLDRRGFLTGFGAAPLFAAGAAWAQTGPYPLETLFRPPALLGATLSPSGAKVALLLDAGRGEARDLTIEVIDAASPSVGAVRLSVGDVDARWLAWAGDERLLLGAAEPSRLTVTDAATRREAVTLDLDYQRVLSLPLDGSEPVVLFAEGKFRPVLNLSELVAALDSGYALFGALEPVGGSSTATMMGNFSTEANRQDIANVSLFRADLATGDVYRVTTGAPSTIRWETKGGQPILRRDLDEDLRAESWWTLPPGAGGWRRVRRIDAEDPDLIFLAAAEAPDTAWVLGRDGQTGPRTLRLWNLAADTLAAPVSTHPDLEPAHVVIDRKGRFVLAEHRTARGVSWDAAEPALPAHLKAVQGYVGGAARIRLLEVDETGGRLLIRAAGPDRPPSVLLYDRAAKRVTELASAAPGLDPERLAPASALGPGVLLSPPGGAPGPLAVVIRSAERDAAAHDWDPCAQAFAARGWWTLLVSGADGAGDLAARAVQERGLDPDRVAVVGWGMAAGPALAMARARGWRAAIAHEPSEPDDALLRGAGVGARTGISVEARDGALALLLLRPPPPRPLGAASERAVKAVFARDQIGGVAAVAEALRGRQDRSWDKPATRLARARAAVDFLARAFA